VFGLLVNTIPHILKQYSISSKVNRASVCAACCIDAVRGRVKYNHKDAGNCAFYELQFTSKVDIEVNIVTIDASTLTQRFSDSPKQGLQTWPSCMGWKASLLVFL
jgi:hypothetical protein